jgi:hypothetical protein
MAVDYTYSDNAQNLTYWYEEKGDKIADSVFATIKFLDLYQGYREVDNLRNMRLYGNLRVLGYSAGNYARTESMDMRKNRVTLNIVQSMCDTVTNKIAKNKPKVTFLTNDGDWSLQNRAKKLDKFIQGQFYSTDIYSLAPQVFLDSTVFDVGVMKIFEQDSKIKLEKVFSPEIRVDDMEAANGMPRSMHQQKEMPRAQVLKLYPEAKHRKFILDAKKCGDGGTGQFVADMIPVVESWHLPSIKDAGDGKHTICIEGHTIIEEEYKKDYFPFVFLRWASRLRGFYGQSLAERLTGKQLEVNKILRTIQISTHLNAIPKVLIDLGSNIVTSHINNEIAGIVKYSGNKPEWITPASIPQDLFAHLKYIVQSSYEEAGISMLSAQSKKPEGLDSGKALREFNDIESERFMLTGQAYEQLFMDVAKIMIDMARDIYTREGEFKAVFKGKKFIETIDWSEVDLEEDKYVMQIFPTTFLSATPSGRLSDATDLVKAGFIDKDNAMRLLDFPDLEAYTSLATASVEDIDSMIERMLHHKEIETAYFPPEPMQNLQLGIQRCQSAYLRAKLNNAPEERLELLRNWIDQASTMLNPPMPEAPQGPAAGAPPLGPDGLPPPGGLPGPMGPGGGPMLAKPEPLPASPLVPQAPMPPV